MFFDFIGKSVNYLLEECGAFGKWLLILIVVSSMWWCGYFIGIPLLATNESAFGISIVMDSVAAIGIGFFIFVIGFIFLLYLAHVIELIIESILTMIEKKFFGFTTSNTIPVIASKMGKMNKGMDLFGRGKSTPIKIIGKAIEQENAEQCSNDIKFYKTKIFKNRIQLWAYFLNRKSIALFRIYGQLRKLISKEKDFLAIIQKYKPLIQYENNQNVKYYFQWESENRCRGGGNSYTLELEGKAEKEAHELSIKAHEELLSKGWRFILLTPNQLLVGREGFISLSNANKYWDDLEGFFQKSINDLSNSIGHNRVEVTA